MPYCPGCGAETEANAAFCGNCGTRLEGEAPPVAPRGRARTGVLLALMGAVVGLAIGGVVLYSVLAGDGDGQPRAPVGGQDQRVEAVSSPTAPLAPEPATATPGPTAVFTATPVPEETQPLKPTTVPTAPGYATAEEAIGAYLTEYGVAYLGDCANADLNRDVGSYCSMLWEDRGDQLIHAAGLAFSEPEVWLLLARQGETSGWLVIDTAEFVPGAQDTVPPW